MRPPSPPARAPHRAASAISGAKRANRTMQTSTVPISSTAGRTCPARQLADLAGVRAYDGQNESRRGKRDSPRLIFTAAHALAAIVLLLAALGVSLTLLVQQTANIAAYEQHQRSRVLEMTDAQSPPASDNGGNDADAQRTGEHEHTTNAPNPAPAQTTDDTMALVDLNTASITQLDAVKGIGPVTAQAIIDYRNTIGGYVSVEQLLDVKGIGPKTLETLREQVTVR